MRNAIFDPVAPSGHGKLVAATCDIAQVFGPMLGNRRDGIPGRTTYSGRTKLRFLKRLFLSKSNNITAPTLHRFH